MQSCWGHTSLAGLDDSESIFVHHLFKGTRRHCWIQLSTSLRIFSTLGFLHYIPAVFSTCTYSPCGHWLLELMGIYNEFTFFLALMAGIATDSILTSWENAWAGPYSENGVNSSAASPPAFLPTYGSLTMRTSEILTTSSVTSKVGGGQGPPSDCCK